jgi:hypothetical protein
MTGSRTNIARESTQNRVAFFACRYPWLDIEIGGGMAASYSHREHMESVALSHLYIETNILPRQSRDKHRESTQKRDRCVFLFLQGSIWSRMTCRRVKPVFLSHLYIKTNILPRQARDKHGENSKKSGVFPQAMHLCDVGGGVNALGAETPVQVAPFRDDDGGEKLSFCQDRLGTNVWEKLKHGSATSPQGTICTTVETTRTRLCMRTIWTTQCGNVVSVCAILY